MMSKANELVKYVKKCESKGKLPSPLNTLYEMNEMKLCFNEMAKNGSATILTNETKSFFEKFGFTVKSEGIGWRVFAEEVSA